jgi:hypothetical protein
MLADHLLPIEDLHGAGELHAPWPRNTLDIVLWGLGDAQLEQTMKPHFLCVGFLLSLSIMLMMASSGKSML